YATVVMVTDFDCWHPDHDAVTVQDIIGVLTANAEQAKALVARLARDFPREHEPCPIGSDRALDTALITAPEARDKKLLKKLDAVAGRGLKAKPEPKHWENPVNHRIPPSSPRRRGPIFQRRRLWVPAFAGTTMPRCSNGLHDAAVVLLASRFSIVRPATVPLAIAVAMHGCAGLETSPTANTPRQDVSMLPSTTR